MSGRRPGGGKRWDHTGNPQPPWTSSHLYRTDSSPHLRGGSGGSKQLHTSPPHRSPRRPGSGSSGHHETPHPARAARGLAPTSHQHWEHPGAVQWLPDSYVAPRCQQAEGPGVGCGAVGPLGEEEVTPTFSCGCEEGLRVPNRGTPGTGVAIGVVSSLARAEGEAAGSAEV